MTQTEEELDESAYGFARVYSVELKYKQPPKLDMKLLYERMEQYTGHTERPDQEAPESARLAVWEANEESKEQMLHFFHLDYMQQYQEGEMPAQTSLMKVESRPIEEYRTALEQSWHWQEAAQTVSECSHSLLLVDMMASGLNPPVRLQLFTNALKAVLEAAPCDAIYFRQSDKLVEPNAYLAAIEEGDRLYGAMNVRFYNVERPEGSRAEGLMDTIGLAALGIPDVQCHFYDLDPTEVANNLGNIGYYLFNQGDIIADGETIGFTEDMRWRCEHQYALASPQRVVIDLDPGEPYYAGRQSDMVPQN